MKLLNNTAEIYLPINSQSKDPLKKTSHLAIAAHPDDLEIMASSVILECMYVNELSFTGVVVTDGRNSPRGGIFEKYTDEEMR